MCCYTVLLLVYPHLYIYIMHFFFFLTVVSCLQWLVIAYLDTLEQRAEFLKAQLVDEKGFLNNSFFFFFFFFLLFTILCESSVNEVYL